MPIIQLKPQHDHTKKKSPSITEPIPKQPSIKQQNPVLQPSQAFPRNLQPKPPLIQQKPATKQPTKPKQPVRQQKQHPRKQSKPQQKPLTVQIIKKQPITSNQQKPQTIQPQQLPTQQTKKKKKKPKRLAPTIQQISPQQLLKQKTTQLYYTTVKRHKLPYNREHPQLMDLLRQSFSTFALKQIQQQKRMQSEIQQMGQVNDFNRERQYNMFLIDQLCKRKKFHQDRIYLGVLQENQLFSDLIWRQEVQSQPKKDEVALMFNDIHLLVINDVWQGQYQIKPVDKPSKDQILYGSYKANQIRMAQSIIKQKLTNLNQQFTIQGPSQHNDDGAKVTQTASLKFNSHKRFDINSQQTKKAEQFVKKLQQEQQRIKQRAIRKRQLQEEEQIKRLQQQQQQRRIQHEQMIQQRRVKLLQKAQQRQRLKKYRQQQQKQYQQYLSQHRAKTPLFKKNQQDFKAFLIKQHLRKLQIMKQQQTHKRSVSKDQIQLHQMKYKQLKQLLDQERAQMLRLQQQEIQDAQMTYYKGKFHQSVMGQVDGRTVMDQRRSKLEELYTRKVQYGTLVKDKFRPKVDLKKMEELQSLIRDLQPKVRDDKLLAEKTKIEGQRNLQKLHQMMGQLRAKGKLKKASTPPSPTKLTNSSRYINYLTDLKSTRTVNNASSTRKSRFSSLDMSNLNHNSATLIQLQARKLQQSADRKNLFLKNTKTLDMQDYLTRKFQLQQDLIQSAMAKVQLLKGYQNTGE